MPGPATSPSALSRPGVVLAVVAVGTLLSAMAGSMVNLALPSLGRDLGVSIETSRWVVQAFLLSVALVLLPAGRLSDALGHGRLYLFGFTLFGAMSVVCGAATGFGVLVAGRVLQGIGAALAMAAGPAILTTAFPASQRGRALGMLSTSTYVGLMAGPPLSGAVIDLLSWRWTFYLMAPISAVVVAVGLAFLPRALAAPQAAARDTGGALARILGLDLFRSRIFSAAVASAVCNYVALFGTILLVPFYIEEGLGLDPSRAGMLLTAQPLMMALTATPAGWLSDRLGSRGLATAGMTVLAGGLLGLSTLGPASGTGVLVAWLGVCGLGTGIFVSPNSSALMGSAPRASQGTAGSLMAEARIVGMLAGVALSSTLFGLFGGRTGGAWSPIEYGALAWVLRASAGVAVLGAILSSTRGPRAPSAPPPTAR